MSEVGNNDTSWREALFATIAALTLAAKLLQLLQSELPSELVDPVMADLGNAENALRWWGVEQDLDQLLEAAAWSHPVQVLSQPCSDFEELLESCELKLSQGQPHRALSSTREKLQRAVDLNRTAAARRAAMRRGEEV